MASLSVVSCISVLAVARSGLSQPTPLRVTVQAQPRFTDVASRRVDERSIELRARLVDDTGAPLGGVAVRARASSGERRLQFGACESAAHPRAAPAAGFPLVTDPDGRLCARVFGPSTMTSMELHFAGNALLLPTTADIASNRETVVPQLAFESRSLELDLDRPVHELRLISGAAFASPPKVRLALHESGRERPLEGSDWRSEDNVLLFSLRSSDLGAPGPARLTAAVESGGGTLLAESVALRVAQVRLAADIMSADAERARVRVSANAASGPPTSGWVEVTRDATVIQSSPLTAGVADLELPVASGASTFLVQYHSEEPWWLSGAPIELSIEGSAPREPRRWPWLVLLAPIAWVCLRALQRPAPRERKARRSKPVSIRAPQLAPAAAPAVGWNGRVYDAHDGWPVAGALVEVALPSLRHDGAALTAVSDADGAFTLPALATGPAPEGARLRVSALLHTEVERALPPQGRVDIAMMSRRRTLLRRLVRWARSMGPPWIRAGDPTPREIVNVALRRGEPHTARWAEAIERAVFGDSRVDRSQEARLRAQEPPWKHTGREGEDRDEQ